MARNKLKTSQTSFFHVPNTLETFRKKNFFESFWPPKFNFFIPKNFWILIGWLDWVEKKCLPDLWGPVKNFLDIQNPWCGYLKHSPRSGLSNARCLMSVRRTQTKRHGVFRITVINCSLRHLLDFTCLVTKIYVFTALRLQSCVSKVRCQHSKTWMLWNGANLQAIDFKIVPSWRCSRNCHFIDPYLIPNYSKYNEFMYFVKTK